MEKYKIIAFIGSMLVLTATIGFMTIIPFYDASLQSRDSNIEMSMLNKIIAETYASTYAILNQINASKEVIDFSLTKALTNYKMAISNQDLKYKEEPLRNELKNTNNISELNRLYNETGSTFVNEYKTKKDERGLLYSIFIVFNSIGLLLVSVLPLLKKEKV